jgi:hypothetical protein
MITNNKLEYCFRKGMALIRNSRSNCSLRCKKRMSGRLQIMKVFMIKLLEPHVKQTGFCQVDDNGVCELCSWYDELKDIKD